MEQKYIIELTRPMIVCVEFELHLAPNTIDIKYKTEGLKLAFDASYSIDMGESWSRYYEFSLEKQRFIDLVKEEHFKGFDILIKLKISSSYSDEKTTDYDTIHDELTYAGIESIDIDGIAVDKLKHYIQSANKFDFEDKSSLFDPYAGMGIAFEIQRTAALSINQMFGHWCYYFKTDPDKESRNMTLKSYQLHNVTDMKRIKVSVPNNTFPSLRNVYSEWGFQLADEFNVHVLCDVFEQAFGLDSFPHTNDYIYFPLTGKMYSVNAYFKNANFMYKAVYHELTLVKYEDDTAVKKDDITDEETLNFMDLTDITELLDDYEKEIEDSAPKYLNTELLDAYRSKLNKNVEIVEYPLNIKHLKLFDNRMLMDKLSPDEIAIEYKLQNNNKDNISFYGWFELTGLKNCVFVKLIDTRKAVALEIGIENKKLYCCTNNKNKIELDTSVQKDKTFGLIVNLSNVYRTISIAFIDYDENTKSIKCKEIKSTDITDPTNYLLKLLQVFGGKYLISGFGLDSTCYNDEIEIEKAISRVTPNAKTNIMFDKSHIPISDTSLAGY